MSEVIRWAISGVLAAVLVSANFANVRLLLGHYRRADGGNPSPVLFVGGIAGALACLVAPAETLNALFLVPLALDLGTGPYLLLAAGVALRERFRRPPPAVESSPRGTRALVGCILGTAVGDALGLACEGLSRERQHRLYPRLDGYLLLPFRKGLCSDDTEHTCMLAQSLIRTAGIADTAIQARKFASDFGWRLRFWVLGLPAGIGLATLRAIFKLWIGFPASRSGVYSAGNGPAMRAAPIGVCYGDDPPRMRAIVRAATRVTHTDPRAEHGALAVALAAHLAAGGGRVAPEEYTRRLWALLRDEPSDMPALVDDVAASVLSGESTADYAARMGWAGGISGYILHTVPAALHAWLSHQGDYRGTVTAVVRLGGDTDTAAAIAGAMAGAGVGKAGIPAEWLRNLWEWPRTVSWMERLGAALAQACVQPAARRALKLSWPGLLVRNAFFVPLVLAHGLRRLLPPY